MTIAEAVCGYMQRDGYHFGQYVRLVPGQGFCHWEEREQADVINWQGLMGVVEGVLDEVETAARELAVAQ